jgi:MYXO-CTERM domain-containing protein
METRRAVPRRAPRAPYHPLSFAAAALALIGALLATLPAHAAGSVLIADRSPKEDDGRWKLKMTIKYGGMPHLAHIPMLFSFTHTVHYERALTDQSPEKPILVRIPLQGQQAINESMDVGFSDGSGKTFDITKFDFVLRRDRGFEAGEYDLKITRAHDGAQMGQTMKNTLQGDKPIIDRRAIVFAGEKKKKKPDEAEKSAPADSEAGEKTEPASAAETPPEEPPAGDPAGDLAVPPKQGGCGCRAAGAPSAPASAALVVLGLGALARVTRRRRTLSNSCRP